MGASSSGGGASGRGEERTDSAKAKINAATHMVAGLSLITAAIVHWNTVYLDRAVRQLRAQGATVPDDLLAHVAPLGWEHIGLTGDYVWTEANPVAPLEGSPHDLFKTAR